MTRDEWGGDSGPHRPLFGPARPVESLAPGRGFPLPLFRDPEASDIKRSGELQRLVNDALWALNWLDGRQSCRARRRRAVDDAVSRMHAQVIARAQGASSRWITRRDKALGSSEAPCASSEAALQRLLKGRGVYEGAGSQNNLAPCCLPRISLPDSLETAPNLVSRVPPDVLPFLQGEQERMLRSSAERQTIVENGDLIKPYMDPLLRQNRRTLVRLVKKLLRVGGFSGSPGG